MSLSAGLYCGGPQASSFYNHFPGRNSMMNNPYELPSEEVQDRQCEQGMLSNLMEEIKKAIKEPMDSLRKDVSDLRTELACVKSKLDEQAFGSKEKRAATRLSKVLTVNFSHYSRFFYT